MGETGHQSQKPSGSRACRAGRPCLLIAILLLSSVFALAACDGRSQLGREEKARLQFAKDLKRIDESVPMVEYEHAPKDFIVAIQEMASKEADAAEAILVRFPGLDNEFASHFQRIRKASLETRHMTEKVLEEERTEFTDEEWKRHRQLSMKRINSIENIVSY